MKRSRPVLIHTQSSYVAIHYEPLTSSLTWLKSHVWMQV